MENALTIDSVEKFKRQNNFSDLCLIPLLATSGATQAITATPELAPSNIQEITTKHILSALREQHYVDQVLDDEVSAEVFDRYIEDLDPSKVIDRRCRSTVTVSMGA